MKFTALVLLAITLAGCGREDNDSPTGNASANVPLMKPFEGVWQFDLEKTIALMKSQGVPQAQLDQMRTVAAFMPSEMKINGNIAVLPGIVEGEYMLFALHPHNQRVCGKAWHHEDRHDPGDMSKCYVRLELKSSDLHFSTREAEDSADPNDPDIINPPIVAGSAQTCGADAAAQPQWSPWMTYVYSPKP